jgi:hypothetical protein
MSLVWEIENFDYFSLDSSNSTHSKEALNKQVNILISIKQSNNLNELRNCLDKLPKINNPFRSVIQQRIRELERK